MARVSAILTPASALSLALLLAEVDGAGREAGPDFGAVAADLAEAAIRAGGEDLAEPAIVRLLQREPGLDALFVPVDAFATGAVRAAAALGSSSKSEEPSAFKSAPAK